MNRVAKTAIDRSESHDEIVTIDHDADAFVDLEAQCDDNVHANGVTEFWANDPESEDKMTWRVHMRDASPATDVGDDWRLP